MRYIAFWRSFGLFSVCLCIIHYWFCMRRSCPERRHSSLLIVSRLSNHVFIDICSLSLSRFLMVLKISVNYRSPNTLFSVLHSDWFWFLNHSSCRNRSFLCQYPVFALLYHISDFLKVYFHWFDRCIYHSTLNFAVHNVWIRLVEKWFSIHKLCVAFYVIHRNSFIILALNYLISSTGFWLWI